MNNSEIKKLLFHPRTNRYHLLAQIKHDSDFQSFNKKLKSIEAHPVGKHALSATPLPKEFSELRRNNIVPHSGNLETEIAWTLDSIKKHGKELNSFIQLKAQFEKSVMLSQFDAAAEALESIHSKICVSNWGIENSFVLAEEKEGTEKNWLLLNKYSNLVQDSLSLFLAEQNSKKSEEKLSYSRFKNNFEGVTSGISNLLNEYLCFKLLYPGYVGFQNFSFFINVESVSSVIDRYLLLVDVLCELIVYDEYNSLVIKVTKELRGIVPDDFRINHLHNIASGNLDTTLFNSEIISYLDNYTSGKYVKCIEDADNLLNKYPSSIEIYLVYVKSLIELNEDYRLLSSKTMNGIAENLFIVFSKKEGYEKSLEDLMKLSLKYFSFNLGKQLFSVVSKMAKLQDLRGSHILLYSLNSEFFNPILLKDSFQLNDLIRGNIENFTSSQEISYKCFEVNKLIVEGAYQAILSDKDIARSRKTVYAARALKRIKNNQLLIQFIEDIQDFPQLSSASKWEIIEILFDAYLEEEDYSKAINLLVENYFTNKNYTTGLNSEGLLKSLQDSDLIISGINLPIFYSIVHPDLYELFVRYDDYIGSFSKVVCELK